MIVALGILGIAVWWAVRTGWQQYRMDRQQADSEERSARHARPEPRVQVRDGIPVEAAFRFSGVPDGWSLAQYSAEGLRQIRILLVQEARRT